ncbi:hypothetical protein VTN00DRAFT_8360 [Thermoascus crustaceus]|uniref:uncharacterized protein n=1 Tax=Thermoascus crustaceus TaxID=5088 RepID=UPI0037439C67
MNTHVNDYRPGPTYRSPEEQERLREHRYPCSTFLAIFSTCKALYADAMPLFYSETFFSTSEIWQMGSFLRAIGPKRQKHVRRIGFQYASPSLNEECSSAWDMQYLVSALVRCERVEVVEIVVLGYLIEDSILVWYSQYEDRDDGKIPGAFSGIEELERLRWLGTLRMVGNWEKMLKYPADARWFKAFAEGKKPAGKGEETGHRPRVVFEEPVGTRDRFPSLCVPDSG